MPWCCGAPAAKGGSSVVHSATNESEADELLTSPSLMMLAHQLHESGENTYENAAFWDNFSNSVAFAVAQGSISLKSTLQNIDANVTSSAESMSEFFSSLVTTSSATVSEPAKSVPSGASNESLETDDAEASELGIPGVDYRIYPIKGYVNLPSALEPFLIFTRLDHYLIVGRPTMAPSSGLRHHRRVTPKSVRADAPFMIVIDKPGMLKEWKDDKYIW